MESTPSPLNVFITGAGGAAGRALTRRLVAAGYRVSGVVNGSVEAQKFRQAGGVPAFADLMREGEIRSVLQGMKANTVVNFAPEIPNQVPHLNWHWEDNLRLIGEGTATLVRAAEAAGIEFLVQTSYVLLYGNTGKQAADETAPTDSFEIDALAAALQAEQTALHSSVSAAVLRTGYVYGGVESLMMRDALTNGRPLTLGEQVASWTHAEDLASAVMLVLQQRPAGEIFNIVDNTPTTPTEFARYFAETMNFAAPGKSPAFFARRLAGKTQTALLGIGTRASNAKAQTALGWKPQYPSYRDGIDQIMLNVRAEEPVQESH
jgi:2-alkyl-3-oxoalkanoate reductase